MVTTEIIPSGNGRQSGLQKFIDQAHGLIGRKELDITTARSILQLVVNTHESSITESSNLNRLGPYHIRDVRQALKVVAFDIFHTHEGGISEVDDIFDQFGRNEGGIRWQDNYYFTKKTKSGMLLATIYSLNNKPWDVSMWLKQHPYDFILTAQIPITKPKEEIQRFYAGIYIDERTNPKTETIPYGEFQIDEFRRSWLGFRWLSDSLLNWDDGFKLPEELEPKQPQLNSSQLHKALPKSI